MGYVVRNCAHLEDIFATDWLALSSITAIQSLLALPGNPLVEVPKQPVETPCLTLTVPSRTISFVPPGFVKRISYMYLPGLRAAVT